MIEGLKPYAEYKESGLPWLDAVPKHWNMVPNRALMRDQRHLVGETASDYTLLSLTLRGVIARDMENPKGKFPAQFNTYKVVRPDDFIFCLFDIDETPRGVGLSPLRGMITGAYDVFRPTQRINPRYLYHYYRFVDDRKLMKPLYTGLRKTIQRGVFASLKAPCPPPDEQAAIVRFLDHANRQIDGFIRAKRKLIGLLNEQKQAIIHRAVTRGLNPDAPLKPSGIPWLGAIPETWNAMRLKALVKESVAGPYGSSLTKAMYASGGYRVYGQQQVIPDDFKVGDYYISAEKFALMRRYQVFPNDILVSVMGTVGRVAVVPEDVEPGIINPRLVRYRPDLARVRPRYLQLTMQAPTSRDQLLEGAKGTTMEGLNMVILARLQLLIPPLVDQDAILDFVRKETATLNSAIARTEREIALMQEYRTRLTADIVTGKLDVREAAAKLPDISDENAAEIPEVGMDEVTTAEEALAED